MTDQERNMLMEVFEWVQQRKAQQIQAPLDDASKNTLGAATDGGAGSSDLTQSVSVSGDPESITVPAAFAGSRIIELGGSTFEIPYL